jgi:Zn finger protein HypA/HybF involved in hydrogenase expression
MGWNDHMQVCETECLDCGEVDVWEYWDDVGVDRYSGSIGQKLNVDPSKSGRCPHCGSTRGKIVEGDD